jgi:hypothetical protein
VPMKLTDVQRIASDVVREQSDRLEVVGAVPAAGESAYTELVLTIRGCQDEPCLLVLGVSRDASEASIRAAVAHRLRDHLQNHAAKWGATLRSS